MVVEAILPPPTKRVKVFTADGREGLQGPHAWALSIGNREPAQRPVRLPDSEAAEATSRASVQDPPPSATTSAALEHLKGAKEGVDLMVRMTDQLEQAQLLGFSNVKIPTDIAGLAHSHAKQVSSRRGALHNLAASLKGGAASLRSAAAGDRAFFDDIGRLQHWWPVKETRGGDSDAPPPPHEYQMEIGLQGLQGLEANSTWRLKLLQGPAGRAVARVSDASAPLPELSADAARALDAAQGADEVHSALKQLVDTLWWSLVQSGMRQEAAKDGRQARSQASFLRQLSQQLHLVMPPDASLSSRAAGVALTGIFVANSKPPPRTAQALIEPATVKAGIFGSLATWLRHSFLREHISHELLRQAIRLPGVQLRWVSCWQSHMSVVEVRFLPGGQRALLLARDHSLELEGVFDHERELRWSKDSYIRILRPEIPSFLTGVVQQMRRSPGREAGRLPMSLLRSGQH